MPGPVIGHFFCVIAAGVIASRLTPTVGRIPKCRSEPARDGDKMGTRNLPGTKKPPDTSMSGGFLFAAKTAYFFKP
jgi:hypothetical protein